MLSPSCITENKSIVVNIVVCIHYEAVTVTGVLRSGKQLEKLPVNIGSRDTFAGNKATTAISPSPSVGQYKHKDNNNMSTISEELPHQTTNGWHPPCNLITAKIHFKKLQKLVRTFLYISLLSNENIRRQQRKRKQSQGLEGQATYWLQ